jgi:hypothetical protein
MPEPRPQRRMPLWLNRLVLPSFVDMFFLVLLPAAFLRPGGLEALLADGDTGWHIRTGQLILETGHAPLADPFSFTRAGESWYAWEWLSDVLFAGAYGRGGTGGVATLAAVVLALSATVLFAWLLRRQTGLWVALGATLAAVSASSVHYLARPHMFSILLYVTTLWLLDEDRRRRGARLWLLVPLAALWANLHAGFVVLPATLVLAAAVAAATLDFHAARRYAAVAAAALAATLANPYGWQLHRHIAAYLTSPWIMDHVQEFQSPNIRTEGMLMFAALLLAGVALASRAMARGAWFEGALVVVWAFAAMRSARHIPFFTLAAVPVVAAECARCWRWWAIRAKARSLHRAAWELGEELGRSRRPTLWIPAAAALALAALPMAGGFPSSRFPVAAVERNRQVLAPGGAMPRILSSDQWSDYLIYTLYPRQRVFFDGRSDFFGPELGNQYRVLQSGAGNWRELLERYRFELALLPAAWPLASVLDREPGWQLVYQDAVGKLFRRAREFSAAAELPRAGATP